jgi:hypothetical protein
MAVNAGRSITAAAVGLVVLGYLVSFGGNNAAADPTATSTPSPSGEVRLGCGTFCQDAGGYGGAGHPSQYAVTVVSSGTVTADPDGYVPVTVTCNLSVQCSGALLVIGPSFSGRSDLLVDAGATRTIGVPLPSSALDYLRSNGLTTLHVTADARQSAGLGNGQSGGPAAINLDSQVTVAAPG